MVIKEFIQVLRDPRARFSLIVPPIMQMLIFGYAASFDVRHVRMAILDLDHSQESRELISRFCRQRILSMSAATLSNRSEIIDSDRSGEGHAGDPDHAGLRRRPAQGADRAVQVILDGTDSNTALVALGYIGNDRTALSRSSTRRSHDAHRAGGCGEIPSVELIERPWFNRTSKRPGSSFPAPSAR